MTDKEKAIVMAYTGVAMLTGEKFDIFHQYIEKLLGRPVYTHELAFKEIQDQIKEKSNEDFLKVCAQNNDDPMALAPAVKAEIKEVLVPFCNVTFDTEKLKELTDGIVERIRNGEIVLQTESAAEWIPVSERLPEEKTDPITNDYYDYICTFHLDDFDDVRVYKFGNGHWWHYGQMMDKYVTAWMPRPEPWKGE